MMVITEAPVAPDARCDRCGAQARMRVTLPSRLDLHFCGHHGREHGDALRVLAVAVVDESELAE